MLELAERPVEEPKAVRYRVATKGRHRVSLPYGKDRKRKITKTTAIIFTSLSILSTTFGAKLITDNKNSEEGVGQSIGTIFIAGGVASAGISIHLFNFTSKRKKERNKLIELYK